MNKKEVLADLGFSKNEVEVYLKLLELGSSTAAKVAKDSKLYAANVGDALGRLVKRGLATHFRQKSVKYFQAVNPEQIMTLLKKKELNLQKILPELKTIQLGSQALSNVSVYEGIMGARNALMEMITDTKELYVLGVPKDTVKIVGAGWITNELHKIRIQRKIKFFHIVNEDYPLYRIKLIREMKYATIRFLPKKYNTPNATFINNNKVLIIFLHPLILIKIDSKEIAKSFKNYFKMIYKLTLETAPQEKKTN